MRSVPVRQILARVADRVDNMRRHAFSRTRSAARIVLCAGACCLALSGCSPSIELYGGLSERDANEVTAELDIHGLKAVKSPNGKQLFAVNIPKKDFAQAVTILQAAGLPRDTFSRMGDIFKKDGMISTPTEERARFIHALSQELESTLSQIDGVVAARVHPVLPQRVVPGEPVMPSSCSILIKHVVGWDTTLYEARIRKLVLASIPGLADAPDKVAVVFVPSERMPAAHPVQATSASDRLPAGSIQGWLIGIAAVVLGIGLPSAWLLWQRRMQSATTRTSHDTVE
ncbi:type III secretion system inner membrane ring lipoprotein SctJ [Roseateles amylovorans]|uniref:Lipoprotein n=1 Tax=Roseateles amylovorans TaxID=2978473 RepID=A0ABY6B3W1_9BURK|nr:type III secretion inner membrane ring lipoprotein SctJ [Roseateles amylovorans]UXH79532.1 type III secretion inner membrane ring lipoprotein SctJ [Roseateles amylovorans]